MPKKKPSNIITISDLWKYKHLTVTWFARAALKLVLNRDIIPPPSIDEIKVFYEKISEFIDEERERLSKRNIDICTIIPLPLTRNDPKDKFNVCSALAMLNRVLMGEETKYSTLTPALSLEFTERTRSFLGPWKLKRDYIVINDDALALAILGAYLTRSYVVKNEYCYVFIDTYLTDIDTFVSINKFGRMITNQVINLGDGSLDTAIVAIALRMAVDDIVMNEISRSGYSLVTMVRIMRTGNRVILKSFDLVEIANLAALLKRLKIPYTVLNLVRNYPTKDEVSKDPRLARYKRYVESLSRNILKYYWLGDPVYLYDIVRPLYMETIVESIKTRLGEQADKVIEGLKSIVW